MSGKDILFNTLYKYIYKTCDVRKCWGVGMDLQYHVGPGAAGHQDMLPQWRSGFQFG